MATPVSFLQSGTQNGRSVLKGTSASWYIDILYRGWHKLKTDCSVSFFSIHKYCLRGVHKGGKPCRIVLVAGFRLVCTIPCYCFTVSIQKFWASNPDKSEILKAVSYSNWQYKENIFNSNHPTPPLPIYIVEDSVFSLCVHVFNSFSSLQKMVRYWNSSKQRGVNSTS